MILSPFKISSEISILHISPSPSKITLTELDPEIPSTLIFFIFSWLSLIFASNSFALSSILVKSAITLPHLYF